MNVLEAIILGIVQGLTEFLPVSSSGHLVLLQRVFNINEPSLFFDTMLHLGTLTAVFVVLWKDIWEILKNPIQKLTLFIIIATLPAVIAALTFKDAIEEIFISAKFLGICFLITTALLVTAEILSKRAKASGNIKDAKDMNWIHALIIGVMQAFAIPPGISRSGATISGALFCKLDREIAARFSFLMSIPAILGAVALQTKDLIQNNAANIEYSIGPLAVIAGSLTSAITGFFAVKFMLKIIKEKSLYGFAIYTGILGIIVILDQLVLHLVF